MEIKMLAYLEAENLDLLDIIEKVISPLSDDKG